MKYTSKMFNIITACLAIYFFIYAGFFIISDSVIQRDIENNILRMKKESSELNAQWLAENKNAGAGGTMPETDVKFKTASEVIIACAKTVMEANSFEILVAGSVSAHVPSLGLTINPEVDFTFRLYENGDRYEQNLRFISGMDYGQRKGVQQIRKASGLEYELRTTDISKTAGKITAKYKNNFQSTTGLYFAPQYFYSITPETILKETYYKKVQLENGDLEYHAQIHLNPSLSTLKYCELMQKQSDAVKLPVFYSIVMTVISDSNGNPKSLQVVENYEIEMNLLGGIKAQNKNNLTYQFICINKPVSTPLPNIN